MSLSNRKLEANRRNAARSTGPRTPEGKARVAQNATSHGCTAAKSVLLHNESHDRFLDLLNSYRDHFHPTNPIAANLVEDLATARWRLYRIWALEAATLDLACDNSAAELRQSVGDPDHSTRLAFAFSKLATSSPLTPELLHRYESRYHRQFYRALNQLNAETRPTEPAPQAALPDSRPQPEPPPEPAPTSASSVADKLRLLATILILCLTLLAPKAAAQRAGHSAKQTHRIPQPSICQPVAPPSINPLPASPLAAAAPSL